MRPIEEMSEYIGRIEDSTVGQLIPLPELPAEVAGLANSIKDILDRRVQDCLSLLSRFSADVVHEVRTPLTNLRSATEIALSKPRTAAEYRKLLASNLEEFESLSAIIHKLLAQYLKQRDDPAFYSFQAEDAIGWLKRCGVSMGEKTRALDLGCGHGVFGIPRNINSSAGPSAVSSRCQQSSIECGREHPGRWVCNAYRHRARLHCLCQGQRYRGRYCS